MANYLVGSATPTLEQANAPKPSLWEEFFNQIRGGVVAEATAHDQSQMNQAYIQGKIDATKDPEALANESKAVQKQGVFLQKSYEQGYLSSAVNSTVSKFSNTILQDAIDMGNKGVSDEDYLQHQRELSAKTAQQLSQYYPHMNAKEASNSLDSLSDINSQALSIFRKTRAAQAFKMNDEALKGRLQSSQTQFFAQQATGGENPFSVISNSLEAIKSSDYLTGDKKLSLAKDYLLSTAQMMDNQQDVLQLGKLASKAFGVDAVDTVSALHSQYQKVAEKHQLATSYNYMMQIDTLKGMSPTEFQHSYPSMIQSMQRDNELGNLNDGDFKSYVNTILTMKNKAKDDFSVQYVQSNNIPLEKLDSATTDKVINSYPKTIQGGLALAKLGTDTSSPMAAAAGNKILGQAVSNLFNNIYTMTKDGTISKDTLPQLGAFIDAYNKGNAGTRQELLQNVPADLRGTVKQAMSSAPENIQQNMVMNIQKAMEAKANGLYSEIPKAISNPKARDLSSLTNWFSFGTNADAQRMAANIASESWDRNVNYNDLLGMTPEQINQKRVADLEANRYEAKLDTGQNLHVYLPYGTTLNDYVGSDVRPDAFTTGIANTINSALSNFNKDNIKNVLFTPSDVGAGGKDYTLSIYSNDGTNVQLYIPNTVVANAAKAAQDKVVSQQFHQPMDLTGSSPVSFQNLDTHVPSVITVMGDNNEGVNPYVVSSSMASIMALGYQKGFNIKGTEGSIPDATAKLKTKVLDAASAIKKAGYGKYLKEDTGGTTMIAAYLYGGLDDVKTIADGLQSSMYHGAAAYQPRIDSLYRTKVYKMGNKNLNNELEANLVSVNILNF